jgi:hypothetical protein
MVFECDAYDAVREHFEHSSSLRHPTYLPPLKEALLGFCLRSSENGKALQFVLVGAAWLSLCSNVTLFV